MKKVKLGDIFKTTSGSTPLTSNRSFYDGGTISWLTSGEVGQGKITFTKNFITKKALEETSVKMLPKHSVVIAMYGATVGEVGILDFETTTNQAVCGILPNKEQADPFYVYYHLLNRKKELINFASGSARTNISQKVIQDFELYLPNIKTQTAIARVLSFLDDKIELNNKINKELENMAKTIYDYWFVQNVDRKWERKKIVELIKNQKNGDWGKETKQGSYTEKVICIRGTDINSLTGNSELKAPERYILEKNNDKFLAGGDFIIEISGGSPTQSTGRMAYILDDILKGFENPLICSNFCKVISLKDKNLFYYFIFAWRQLYENGLFLGYEGKTSGIKNFLFDNFVNFYKIVIPPTPILQKFNKIVSPLFSAIIKNRQENICLAEQRDFLLPLLMGGEVGVNTRK